MSDEMDERLMKAIDVIHAEETVRLTVRAEKAEADTNLCKQLFMGLTNRAERAESLIERLIEAWEAEDVLTLGHLIAEWKEIE